MIAIAKPSSSKRSAPAWHKGFLAMLPAIRRNALVSFRGLTPTEQEEAVQEVICNALFAYHRLFELGKTNVAYPSALARFGVAQFRAGRRVGNQLNIGDVTSDYCQRRKGVQVEHLDRYDREEMVWHEVLIEDRHAGPAETAAARLDISAWLHTLSARQRKIATLLAAGESTSGAARRFRITAGRISQLRRELMERWESFTADRPAVGAVCSA